MPLPGPTPRTRRRRPASAPTVLSTIAPARRPRPQAKRPASPAAGAPHTGTTAPSTTRPGFDWGNGRGGHSISLADHQANQDPLYDPTNQLSGAALSNAAKNLVGLEFNPREEALKRELGAVTTQGAALSQRAGDYSSQIATNDASIPGQEAAIQKLLTESLAGNATTATGAVDKNLAGVDQRASADLQLRGGVGGTGLETAGAANEAQTTKDQIAGNAQTSKDAAALSTQAYEHLASLTTGAHSQMGQETQQGLLNRTATQQADVRGRQADLATERGAATGKAVADLRQQAFENLITQGGLNLKSKDLKAQTDQYKRVDALAKARIDESAKTRRQRERIATADRTARAEADRAAQQAASTNQGNKPTPYGYTNAEWLQLPITKRQQIVADFRKKQKKGSAGMSPAATQKRTRIDSMLTDIGNDPKLAGHVQDHGQDKRHGYGRLVEILTKRGADPLEAQAAAEIARHKVLSPGTAAALRRAGISIPAEWLPHTPASQGAGTAGHPVSKTGARDVAITRTRRRKR